jgi:hypothetical protein
VLLAFLLTACVPETEPEPLPPCSEGEAGVELGDLFPDLPAVLDCDGNEVRLRELACGAPLTLVDVGAASFDQCVDATIDYVNNPAWDPLVERGLQIVQVFTTDAQFQPADLDFCANYTEAHGVDFAFFVDGFAVTDVLGQLHPLNIVLDEDAVIVERWEGDLPDDRVDLLDARLE